MAKKAVKKKSAKKKANKKKAAKKAGGSSQKLALNQPPLEGLEDTDERVPDS